MIRFDKKHDTWVVGPKSYPADKQKVKDMVEVIESLAVTALVSESKNYIRYELNDSYIAIIAEFIPSRPKIKKKPVRIVIGEKET